MDGERRATVVREADKVWLDGVPGFDPGQYASSPHGCMASVLAVLGDPLGYDDLVCYGGFAFRIGAHAEMCPSAAHPYCGPMCIERSVEILPWRLTCFSAAPWDKPKEDRAAFEAEVCAAIRDSIDGGLPVHYGGEEDGLIVGYADGGRRWLCLHPYQKWGRERFWHDEVKGFGGGGWPWTIAVWQEPKPPAERPDLQAALSAALRQAGEMWQTERCGDYYCGEAAYAHWLGWLRAVEDGMVDKPESGMQGNGWYYDVLVHCREIAARWLRRQAEGLAGETRRQMLVAAGHYEAMARELMDNVGCPWSLALPPNRRTDWTSALRLDQIRRLESAREHDRAAIAALGQMLVR